MLNITFKATQFEITPAIRAYAEEKVRMIERLLDDRDADAHAEVELEQTTRHHQSGDIFRAEINLHTAQLSLRTEAEEGDLYAAIDVAKDELVEELRRLKEKKSSMVRRGGRMFKDVMRKMGWGNE
ncbi:MAG: hypothetical protein RLY47_468 [Candidatus Parcubacteria bacterium]